MNTLELPDGSLKMEIPSHWDEMTDTQRKYCLTQVIYAGTGLIDVDTCRVNCFYHLADIKRDWKSICNERLLSEEMRLEKHSRIILMAEELTAFLFKLNDKGQLDINYDTVYNHFPVLRSAGGTLLYGPAHLLADITFGEFRAAVEEMNDYFQHRDEAALCRFVACLYRPQRANYAAIRQREDFDGQQKEPFNRGRIEINAAYAEKLAPVYRVIVLTWFCYLMHYIQSEDLELGGRTVNFSRLFPKSSADDSSRKSGGGWTAILHSIAKEGPFGKIQDTDQAGLFDILLFMQDMHEQNLKLKAQKPKSK